MRRTQALPLSSSSFSGCLSPDQNSGTTAEDRCICNVSRSQMPSSWPRSWLHSRAQHSERLWSITEQLGDIWNNEWCWFAIFIVEILKNMSIAGGMVLQQQRRMTNVAKSNYELGYDLNSTHQSRSHRLPSISNPKLWCWSRTFGWLWFHHNFLHFQLLGPHTLMFRQNN